jgi:pimeloyl-ACP methyl ester carboxylesterase
MPRRFLAGFAFCLLLLTPAAVRAQAALQAFDANGVKICYTVEGKGEPVVLIHGFSVNYQGQWALPGVTRELAKDYQVISFDNRGHGRSGKPHDPKQYGMEMVEDVIRLLDHLKIKRAHVVGYSLGAFITLKLLTTHPDRLLTATLGGAGRGKATDMGFLDELAGSLEQGKGFGPLLLRLTPPGKAPPTEQEIQSVNQFLTAMNDVKALAAVVRGMKELTVSEEKLKANQVPTLALIGDQDPLKEGVDALRGQLPNLQVVVLKGADHLNAFARPEFVGGLKVFLAKYSQGGKNGRAAVGEKQR